MTNTLVTTMKSNVAVLFIAFAMVFSMMGLTVLSPQMAGASAKEEICKGAGGELKGGKCISTDKNEKTLTTQIKEVVNVLLFIIGAVAVIMIVIGGLRYTISNGDSGQITSAKNTILYAVVGLVVAMLAYAIVNFVVDRF